MLTYLFCGVAGLVVLVVLVVLALAATKPSTFRVERRVVVRAAPERIFPHLEDFHRWTAWSPWERMDPAMERTYGGAASGVGATYAWRGNGKVGEGRMNITESRPSEHLALRLEFLKPFAATNTTVFTLAPQGSGTEVSWAMTGTNTFGGKVFAVFVDMDRLVGKDFERGLAELARVAEAAA